MIVEYAFRHVINKVKQVFPGHWVVAGGAVRDTIMGVTPKDWDVYLLDACDRDWGDVADAFRLWRPSPTHHVDEYTWLRLPVNTYETEFGLCQLMLSKCGTMGDLIDTFDWNVSLFASDGVRTIKGMETDDICPGRKLKLNALTYPTSSMRRGFRFSERYGMCIDSEDMRKLIDGMKEEWSGTGVEEAAGA